MSWSRHRSRPAFRDIPKAQRTLKSQSLRGTLQCTICIYHNSPRKGTLQCTKELCTKELCKYVCMYVYIYIYLYISLSLSISLSISLSLYLSLSLYIYIYIHIHIHTYLLICIYIAAMQLSHLAAPFVARATGPLGGAGPHVTIHNYV